MLAALARATSEAKQLPEMFQPAMMLAHFQEVDSALDQFAILAGPPVALSPCNFGGGKIGMLYDSAPQR